MEHRQAVGRPATSCRASGDDPARFLSELRQLRDGAGLGQAELAARAHYPYDRIRAAEVGPSLPDLPVLSAYVRGCGGTTEEWEERWRSLTSAPAMPLLTARPAGSSTAATAGARIGSTSPLSDAPDPSVILAALDRVAEEMAVGTSAPPPSRAGLSTIGQRSGAGKQSADKPSTGKPSTDKHSTDKAGAAKPVAWETTATRTGWDTGTTSGPTAWDTTSPAADATAAADAGTAAELGTGAHLGRGGDVRTAAEARADAWALAGDTTRTVADSATHAGSPGGGAVTREPAWPTDSIGYEAAATTAAAAELPAAQAAASAASASAAPATRATSSNAAPAATASAAKTTPSSLATAGQKSRGLSRTTIAALIAVLVCVLAAALAIFA